MLAQLVEKHPNDVLVVYRHFPLPNHPLSIKTGAAAEAAGLQGKFWEMHDAIFSNQQTWATMTEDQFASWATDEATKLGLNKDQFVKDMNSKQISDKLLADRDHAEKIQLPGTPFVLLNGQYFQGPYDLAQFESILGMFQLKDRQFTNCPPMVIDPKKHYTATLKTEKGNIAIELYPDKAPMAVNNFVFLAQQGWYNNTTFHRVIKDFVAQGGDPSGTGFGGPGYTFDNEISDLKFDQAGLVAMANAGPGSNGSQFFITFSPQSKLDGSYTIFGKVIEGLDVAKSLTERDPSASADLPPGDKLISVDIQEK